MSREPMGQMMSVPEFTEFSVWTNVLVLAAGACTVWWSGARLAVCADAIFHRTKIASALAGALLLGGATSLPELATTLTASRLGNAPLAVNNLFGGIAMQFAVLAAVDLAFVRGALTYFSPRPVLLLRGVLVILQISLGLAAISCGDVTVVFHCGAWPIVLAVVYGQSLYFMQRYTGREVWIPAEIPEDMSAAAGETKTETRRRAAEYGRGVYVRFALFCGLVLIAGWAVSSAADALSAQSGVGSGFIGATLVALATSLPEISTTAGGVRLGAYTMAMSNIFGTNALEVALLLPADLAYTQGAVVNDVDESAIFVGALGIAMTTLYLWGLLERRNRTVLRMGVDSALVLIVYLVGLCLLYRIP